MQKTYLLISGNQLVKRLEQLKEKVRETEETIKILEKHAASRQSTISTLNQMHRKEATKVMSEEIKVTKDSIASVLADLNTATQSMETIFSSEINGDNRLDTVNKINHIKQQYESALKSYQALLTQHIKATHEAVESMIQTDEELASGIKLMK